MKTPKKTRIKPLITTVMAIIATYTCNGSLAATSSIDECVCAEQHNAVANLTAPDSIADADLPPIALASTPAPTQQPPQTTPQYAEEKNWGILFYTGATSTQQLGQLIRAEFNSAGETLYTGEIAYTLSPNNLLRRIFQPLISTMQVAGNVTYRNEHRDTPNIWEYDAYLIFRWQNFPWKNYLDTSLAAAEGISYTSHVPAVEEDGTTSDGSQRLLNYLMFEAAFALPSKPDVQLAVRIQHRSNAYGVFGTGNAGSNNVGLGIRYLF